MSKLKLLLVGCLTILLKTLVAQSYPVQYHFTGNQPTGDDVGLKTSFASRNDANAYLAGLPALLTTQGYITASIDSLSIDSSQAQVQLFLGEQFKWASINIYPEDEEILNFLQWPKKSFKNDFIDWKLVHNWQERILHHLENTGYPFAKVYLDSIVLVGNEVAGWLKIEKGPLHKIDSIVIEGDARISKEYLQRLLNLPNGSIYSKKKLQAIETKIREITYLEEIKPASVSLSAAGSVLNLYLKAKKTSQINFLVGFLPNSNPAQGKKFLITGEANMLLRNSLGAGETIGLNWQQLQVKSPRLHILYDHPFIFKSPLGLNFAFDMFRKDSTFMNVNFQLGAIYSLTANQSATVFLQKRQSILTGVDTLRIKQTQRLPTEADVSATSIGVTYMINTTNYRFNPQRGSELQLTTAAGNKKIKKNNQITGIKDPFFSYESLYDTVKQSTYQYRINAIAAHYFQLGRQTVLKAGVNAGLFKSGNYFLNEFFQIGGYKLLRGFTEESEYVAQYAVATLEYRYLVGQNSNFFAFLDAGAASNPLQDLKNRRYIGTGLGMAFETKAGIFNLAWAVGKRNDAPLNLRQSKIHFGFINYF